MSRRIPSEIDVDLLRTAVKARLPLPFDGSSWTASFLPTCVVFRRLRTKQTYIVEYETAIQRAIKADVEEARRSRKRKRGRSDGTN